MVQRLRLHAPPQERALPVLQPKRTKSFDIIEYIIENGRLQKELPALPQRPGANASIISTRGSTPRGTGGGRRQGRGPVGKSEL